MIEVDNLVRRYGSSVAVDGISFKVEPREVVGFLGPNGAGKTTTIRVLTAYLPPSEGTVRVDGLDVVDDSLEVRRRIGYLPENNPQYEDVEVSEYLEWLAQVRRIPLEDRTKRIRMAVQRCGLGDALGKSIGQLSKGFRQRVGVAQAILHDPPILFLDEPSSGLDPNQARDVCELIRELKKEKTVFLSTHILSEVQAVCDRVLIIHKGRIVAQGKPAELVSGAPRRVRVTLKSADMEPEAAAAEFLKVEGVSSAEASREDGELRLEVQPSPGRDVREALFRFVMEKRWTLLELTPEQASLEEVFHQLTL